MAGRPRGFEPETVLDRAMAVFWANGYAATGIADLEKATELGRQSLYGAFGDKRELFERVVEHYFERVLRPAIVDVLDAGDLGRENIERVLRQWEAAAMDPSFNGCLVGNAASELGLRDGELREVLKRKLRLLEDAFYRAIHRAEQRGEVRKGIDARATARSLVATAQGLAVVARANREKAFIRDVVDSARRLLD